MKIRRDDTVVVIAGRDKGKRGKVRQSLKRESCVVVEGVNMVKRHTRPCVLSVIIRRASVFAS